ncbi:MAG TPA: 4-(cytidine 5'-diphospho)-2-C-methyl-D-erythritol kinase [Desulfobacteraceae bacterium]|nr:4-(cytidine 5'-diphospho)-2-C-methyl-D-erythritol kinase [Desulfobacteraceae bacterium]
MIRLLSPAKINLFLHVTGRRPDGFHELYSLMAPIDLCDRIDISFSADGVSVLCDHPHVPEDESNIAHKAAVLFSEACDQKNVPLPFGGIAIAIEKNIPVGGGLGGGSSNAAMVLMALNQKMGHLFANDELMRLGVTLGADVPFFMGGGPAFATGIGEGLSPCTDLPDYWLVLCDPGVSASTVKVFGKLGFGLTFKPDCTINPGSNVLPIGRALDGREKLQNDLEGPACELYPEIGATKEEMALLLQRNVYMSGSGSSLFALYSDHDGAKAGFDRLRKAWKNGSRHVYLSRVGQNRRCV